MPLDDVGITDLVYPVTVPAREGAPQTTAATIGLFIVLGTGTRGAHMSRFIQILDEHPRELTPAGIRDLLTRVRDAHAAQEAGIEIECDFFVPRKAPVSGAKSLMACPVTVEASLGEEFDFVLTVEVPVMTVCPCSQEARGGPAHSQRGYVSVSLRFDGRFWIEEVAELVEDGASAPIFPLLKSVDERSLLDSAHRTPVLVEDLVRNVAERLDSDVRVHWYSVEAENLDSVHDHNVYAHIERSR
jgi:GTP cyclohydrolase I